MVAIAVSSSTAQATASPEAWSIKVVIAPPKITRRRGSPISSSRKGRAHTPNPGPVSTTRMPRCAACGVWLTIPSCPGPKRDCSA